MTALQLAADILAGVFLCLLFAAVYVAVKIEQEEKAGGAGRNTSLKTREVFMSWSLQKKGAPAEVLSAVKADSGVQYMPDALPLLIEELLSKVEGGIIGKVNVSLSTNGHVFEGIGDVHLSIAIAPAEDVQETAAEAPKEEVPA